jgi:hypothetical protein
MDKPVIMSTLFILSCMAVSRIHAASPVAIVRDSQPRAVIVTAAEPTESAQRAAKELQHFLVLISGAELPICAGIEAVPAEQQQAARLFVGRSDAVKELGVSVPSGDDLDRSREGFVLKTVGNGVVAAGNEDSIRTPRPWATASTFLMRITGISANNALRAITASDTIPSTIRRMIRRAIRFPIPTTTLSTMSLTRWWESTPTASSWCSRTQEPCCLRRDWTSVEQEHHH